jgi:hypothetical protein
VFSVSQALYVVDAQISEAAITAIGAWATAGGQVRTRVFLRCHFMLKIVTLPRQARDEHRENSKGDRSDAVSLLGVPHRWRRAAQRIQPH